MLSHFNEKRNQELSEEELRPILIESHELFEKMAHSPRYQNIQILSYVNDIDKNLIKQFSAMTLLLEDQRLVVAYRGTDDSLIGWHEDFLMLCENVVPAQVSSVEYLEYVASFQSSHSLLSSLQNKYLDKSLWQRLKKHFQYQKKRPIWLVGHSKGGNLAMYAGCFCQNETKQRILKDLIILMVLVFKMKLCCHLNIKKCYLEFIVIFLIILSLELF